MARLDAALLSRAIDHEAVCVAHLGRALPAQAQLQRARLRQLRAAMVAVAGEEECGELDTLTAEITGGMRARNAELTAALLLSLTSSAQVG